VGGVNLVIQLLIIVLWLYFILLIGRLILDYVQMFARSWRPSGPVLVLAEIIYTATDPPLRALRRVIPPLRLGSISLDLSFLVLLILIQVMISVLQAVAAG
jgi:YggT family protein